MSVSLQGFQKSISDMKTHFCQTGVEEFIVLDVQHQISKFFMNISPRGLRSTIE